MISSRRNRPSSSLPKWTSASRLFVADYASSRVLVFDVASITNGENAVNVLGQTTFTASSGATAQNRLRNPVRASLDAVRGWLFVGDYANHRVMVFDVNSITNGENAFAVLGQATFTTSTSATSQTGLKNPSGLVIEQATGRLFVADMNNHRVMVFDAAAITNGEPAINVLGQATFTTATSATTQSGMKNPQGVALDTSASRLFVADTNNHRVTIFDAASITNGENAVNVLGQLNFTSGASATTQGRMYAPMGVLVAAPTSTTTTSIAYDYDPLYRLTEANYNGGPLEFAYTYDAVGNLTRETTQSGYTDYVYDDANRMTSAGGVPLTWSDNGNLLTDGTSTYTYDHANRLVSVSQGSNGYVFLYTGLGDRVRQTVNGVPTSYTLDLEGGLTQVLSDGTNAYLYGNGRLAEEQPGGWAYHLPDALGSVRQLADASGGVTLAHAFEPYGESLGTSGAGDSAYGFTGEWTDATGLVHLRARYYAPYLNQWIQPDPLDPDPRTPAGWNLFAYVRNNPVNVTDPSGLYGDRVHYYLVESLAAQEARLHPNTTATWCKMGICNLPQHIAKWDLLVDDWIMKPLPLGYLGAPDLHFVSHDEAWSDLARALRARDPSYAGAALHEVQDYWSHYWEGYRWPGTNLGHGIDTGRYWMRPESPGDLLFSLYREGEIAAPSREALEAATGLPASRLRTYSTWNLLDLWMRTSPGQPETRREADWKDKYGYDMDAYFDGIAPREARMRQDTRVALEVTFNALGIQAPCGFFDEHSAFDVKAFLRGGRSSGP